MKVAKWKPNSCNRLNQYCNKIIKNNNPFLMLVLGIILGTFLGGQFLVATLSRSQVGSSGLTALQPTCLSSNNKNSHNNEDAATAVLLSTFSLPEPPTTTTISTTSSSQTTDKHGKSNQEKEERLSFSSPDIFWKFWGQYVRPKSQQSFFGIDKIYVAHWSVDTDRRKRMEERLNKIFAESSRHSSVDWRATNFVSFVTELDGGAITKADATQLAGGPTTLEEEPVFVWNDQQGISKGALSLSAKHSIAYYDALVHGYSIILIVEDDADFVPQFGRELQEVIDSMSPRNHGWSNVMIANPHNEIIPCLYSSTNSKVCRQPKGHGSNGSVAYIMSLTGCRHMINSLPIRRHSDWQMNWASELHSNFVTFRTLKDLAFEDTVSVKGSWRQQATS